MSCHIIHREASPNSIILNTRCKQENCQKILKQTPVPLDLSPEGSVESEECSAQRAAPGHICTTV